MARTKASARADAAAQEAAIKAAEKAKARMKPKENSTKSKGATFVVSSLEQWIPDGWHSYQGPGTRKTDSVSGWALCIDKCFTACMLYACPVQRPLCLLLGDAVYADAAKQLHSTIA